MAKRKFHKISWSFLHARADFEVENLDVLLSSSPKYPGGTGIGALYPPPGRRGFPEYPEKPHVVIGKRRKGPPPSDIELFHSYWLVSDRLKLLFESVDPSAFAFQACNVTLRDGSRGPVYWLCDVIRVLDAFDQPTVQDLRTNRNRFPTLRDQRTLVFDETVIGDSHIFRTPYWPDVFCDQSVKDMCRAAGMKGLRFVDCTPKRRRSKPSMVAVRDLAEEG
jgi:hypothetical protein